MLKRLIECSNSRAARAQAARRSDRGALRIKRQRGGFYLIETALVLMLAIVVSTQLIQIS